MISRISIEILVPAVASPVAFHTWGISRATQNSCENRPVTTVSARIPRCSKLLSILLAVWDMPMSL